MNERIRELAEQAGYEDLPTVRLAFHGFDKKKFAQLIAAECADLCDRLQEIPATEPRHCANDIRSTFGIFKNKEEDEQ